MKEKIYTPVDVVATIRIYGQIIGPMNNPEAYTTIILKAISTNWQIIQDTTATTQTDQNGNYDFSVYPGKYAVFFDRRGLKKRVNDIQVYSDSQPGPLQNFMLTPVASDLTPLIVRQAIAAAELTNGKAIVAIEAAKSAVDSASSASLDAAAADASASSAASDAGTAEQAASSAGGSAVSAASDEELAHKWADNPEDMEVQSGEFSAFHWAQKAKEAVSDGAVISITSGQTVLTPDTQGNITLGTAATATLTTSTTDSTVGHVLKVGDRGLGVTILGRLDNFDFNSYTLAAGETLFITMATAKNIPDELSTLSTTACYLTALGIEDGAGGVSFVISDASTGETYFCTRLPPSGGVISWFVNKLPTIAADVSALALSTKSFSTGDDFNSAPAGSTSFVYGAALNAPPVNCVVIDWWGLHAPFGDNPGYRGQIGADYTNGRLYFRTFNGDDNTSTPWDLLYSVNNPPDLSAYIKSADAAAWFIQSERQGAVGHVDNGNVAAAPVAAPAGCVMTQIWQEGDWIAIDYRPQQYLLNGTWVNAGVSEVTGIVATPDDLIIDSPLRLLTNIMPYQHDGLRSIITKGGRRYVQHFISDEGYDWYEASKLLAGNVFVAFDTDGVIRHLDADATTINPNGLSVAGLDEVPEGAGIDGSWKFDGTAVYQDEGIVSALTLEKNTRQFNRLLRACTDAAFPMQSAQALGLITTQQQAMLTDLQNYAINLADTDLTQNPVAWPAAPVSVKLPL
jgi:hypothetical protein